MQEARLVLIFVLATIAVVMLAWLALFSVVSAKSRIIREQRKSLEAEQRLRRAQSAFTDNAHHELKTPLQILSGHLYMLRMHDPTPEQERLLSQAETATRRLQSLVQDLLDFTALHNGSLRIHARLMDLETNLQALIDDYSARAVAKGLTFHTKQDPLAGPVVCDGPRLQRALATLLENAVRFTATGSIQANWTVHREAGRCHLRFEVADTGPGLPTDWPLLLQPFEQGAVQPHRVQEGLGLGLPLAAGLLRAMGGQMGLAPQAVGTLAWAEISLDEAEA